jgi:hypothetical protein
MEQKYERAKNKERAQSSQIRELRPRVCVGLKDGLYCTTVQDTVLNASEAVLTCGATGFQRVYSSRSVTRRACKPQEAY